MDIVSNEGDIQDNDNNKIVDTVCTTNDIVVDYDDDVL